MLCRFPSYMHGITPITKQWTMDNIGLIVITALAVMFVTPYLYMKVSAARAVGKSVPVEILNISTDDNIDKPCYVYFMSQTCSSCKKMTPVIEQLNLVNPGTIIIDINQAPELANEFHIYGTPTLMEIKQGLIKKVKLGKLSENRIKQFLNP